MKSEYDNPSNDVMDFDGKQFGIISIVENKDSRFNRRRKERFLKKKSK